MKYSTLPIRKIREARAASSLTARLRYRNAAMPQWEEPLDARVDTFDDVLRVRKFLNKKVDE